MSNFNKMFRHTSAALAAAMMITMGSGAVMTQAKTAMPSYKVTSTIYADQQKEKQMEASIYTPKVTITGTDGKVMKEASKKLNAKIANNQKKLIKQYESDVKAISDGSKGHESVTSTYKVIKNSSKIFTLRVDTVIAMGGSQSSTKIYNVDKKTGKSITLKNLFKSDSDYIDRISDNIKEQMRAQMKKDDKVTYFLADDMEGGFDRISSQANFYINKKGQLTVVFDKYEVAPGAMGVVEFSIPSKVLSDIAVKGYLK